MGRWVAIIRASRLLRHVGGEEVAVLVGFDEDIRAAGSVGQGVGDQIDGRGKVAARKPLETIVGRLPYSGHRGARIDEALDLGVVPGLG